MRWPGDNLRSLRSLRLNYKGDAAGLFIVGPFVVQSERSGDCLVRWPGDNLRSLRSLRLNYKGDAAGLFTGLEGD